MGAVLAAAEEHARADERIVTWSVCPGFARSDNAATGAHIYVVATDPEAADVAVEDLAGRLWAARRDFLPDLVDPAAAIARARGCDGLVVISDQGDNLGGGASGDGTTLLALLTEARWRGAVVAALHDPDAVAACVDIGVGARLHLALGGRTDDRHGPPFETT